MKDLVSTDITQNDNEQSSRAILTGQHSYYRSKVYTTSLAINPLVASGSPLFTLVNQLKQMTEAPDINQLYQDLCHEIKAFENKAQNDSYRSNTLLAARYAICTLLDEIITEETTWGTKSNWQRQALLQAFQREAWGGERFFLILERSCEDATFHIDLLEWLYLCISLGYEGKYRRETQGYKKLQDVADDLYQTIMRQRGDFSRRMLSHEKKEQQIEETTRLIPIWLVILISIIIRYNI